jgi:hypothetical protein
MWICITVVQGIEHRALDNSLACSFLHLVQISFFNPKTANLMGRTMVQVACRRCLSAEARVRARVSPCGTCGGQSGTGTGLTPSS